jgi:microsomal dipeptidase-like Zn-dependent dipeptidase
MSASIRRLTIVFLAAAGLAPVAALADEPRVTLADVPMTGARVTGSAAIHEHVMAEHAFSGKWFWGSVDGAENVSLGLCDGDQDTHAGAFGACADPTGILGKDLLGRDTCCHKGGLGDCNFKATNGNDPDAGDEGWDYLDWPVWDTQAHPRYWHGHLRKALAGGLKLMVVHAVDNYLLCTLVDRGVEDNPFRSGYHCTHGDSRDSVMRQIDELKQFAANHADFMEIAYTPAQARDIINNKKKLALVIGIEADYAWGNEKAPIDLTRRLQDYFRRGARTIYLAHMVNTRLAGSAQYVKELWGQQSMSNCFFLNKQCKSPDDSVPPEVPFRVNNPDALCDPNSAANYYDVCKATFLARAKLPGPEVWDGFLRYPAAGAGISYVTETNRAGDSVLVRKNLFGLTSAGETVVNRMMDTGMLVEIGHLSEKAVDAIYALSQANHNYPLIASHALPRRLLVSTEDEARVAGKDYAFAGWERELTDATLQKIKNSEGIVGHFAGPHPALTYPPAGVANTCVRSTRSLAQLVAYTVDQGVKVAWAGDFMGQASGVAPRLGFSNNEKDWCGGIAAQQAQQTTSPVNPRLDAHSGQFNKDKAYFATRGLGHFGLIRHLHDDLAAVGLPPRVLAEFRDNAAENFIRTWEKSAFIADQFGQPLRPVGLSCFTPQAGVLRCTWEDTSAAATGFALSAKDEARGQSFPVGPIPYARTRSVDVALGSYPGGTIHVEVRTLKGTLAGAPAVADAPVLPPTCGNGVLDAGEACDFEAALGGKCGTGTCRVLRTCVSCQQVVEDCPCQELP